MAIGTEGPTDQTVASSLPITQGRLLDLAHDPLKIMRQLYRVHGRIAALEEQGQRVLFAFGPEYNQQLLSDTRVFHSRFFALRGPRNSAQRRLTGALLGMNGEEYKRHRRLVMGPFQKKSIEGYRDALTGLAELLVRDWRPGQVRDIFEDMTQHMLRVTSSLLFGFDVPELAYEIGRRIAHWVAMNHELGLGAFISDPGITSSYSRLLTTAEELETEIRRMIEHRRSTGNLGRDVLSLLIQAHDETGAGLSDAELIAHAAVLFGAAHLTTANTLAWTLFLLAQHPEAATPLVEELQNVLHGEAPTVCQLEQLPFLERVIKESMRVLPASAYVQRVNAEPVQVGPFRLSKGTVIVWSQFITHHLPDLYPEPEVFRPERWLTIRPSPYAFLPFGAGPRMCLGGPLAMFTIKITLPVILQRFGLKVVPGASINARVISTMLTPSSPIPMLILPPASGFSYSAVTGNIHELMTLQTPAPPALELAGAY